jgi:hypothetical protein
MLASVLAILPMQIILVTIAAVGLDMVRADQVTGYAFLALLGASAAFAAMAYWKFRRLRQATTKVEDDVRYK